MRARGYNQLGVESVPVYMIHMTYTLTGGKMQPLLFSLDMLSITKTAFPALTFHASECNDFILSNYGPVASCPSSNKEFYTPPQQV